MKRWWATVTKDYFTFSKKERVAFVVLIVIGVAVYFLPSFFSPKKSTLDPGTFKNEIAQLKISIDTSKGGYKNYRNDDDQYDYYQPKHYAYEKTSKGELFAFDPNTLDEGGWKRLGLRAKTIQTIQNFIAKGYKFRQAEDIKKIYGLHEDEAERLIPYVQIIANAPVGNNQATSSPAAFTTASPAPLLAPAKNTPRVFDINAADTSVFISLPGIGGKLAARIVNFRDKLGGFVSVQQVGETYGVPDSTFQKIKSYLQCNKASVHTININTADAGQLKHPYIKWNVANAIISYRQQHGNYKSLDDLKKIDIITEELFQKIAPYLAI